MRRTIRRLATVHRWLLAWAIALATTVATTSSIAEDRLVPAAPRLFEQVGIASWYGVQLRGRRTASGDRFDPRKLTAAHPTLPLGSHLHVTNLDNGRSVDVRVNDRGPGIPHRIVDLSRAAAARLGGVHDGLMRVRISAVTVPRRVKR